MHAELHIACVGQDRKPGRLDSPWTEEGPLPTVEQVQAAVASAPEARCWLLSGGEPTLRPDLPKLIETVASTAPVLGMRTDGLLLNRPGIDQQLSNAGLKMVRIPLHCGRADAHDWLVCQPGAGKRIRKAMDQCAAGPLELQAEVTITRPTAPYLLETISLLVRHGVSSIYLRMLRPMGAAAEDYVALAPRLGLLQPILEDAIRQALRHGVAVQLDGVPLCGAPGFPECHRAPQSVVWAIPEGVRTPPPFSNAETGCPGCPGPPECNLPPQGYTRRFGWTELQSEGGIQARAHPATSLPRPRSGEDVPLPPGRAGRAPATRLRAAVRQSENPNIGGDPLAGRHPDPDAAKVVAMAFAPHETSRTARLRLVRAAQHGAHTLRIEGESLHHPDAHVLLREAQRLSFENVDVRGEVSAMDTWSDAQIFHLRGLRRLDLVFFGTDAAAHDAQTGTEGSFDASLRVAKRISRIASIEVGAASGTSDAALTEALRALLPAAPSPEPALWWDDEQGGTIPGDSR